jgi:hypothetical protein|tara:strand:- start:6354 stop:6809 length:456 start_codon:yes stop_codon:yes gene_type:complete
MANFLSYDGAFCHHEGLVGCRTMTEYREKVGAFGDSSTVGMLLNYEETYPDAPVLIIERGTEAAIDFGSRVLQADVSAEMQFLKEKMDKIEGMRVDFDRIDDKLEDIWDYLIGTPYDGQRGSQLSKMNVQVSNPMNYELDLSLLEEIHSGF